MHELTRQRNGAKFWFQGGCAVVDRLCAWRRCFHPHDMGHNERVYDARGIWSSSKWVPRGYCVTNFQNGCPENNGFTKCCDAPDYAGKKGLRISCKNCGSRPPKEVRDFIVNGAEEATP